jgi:hypothetical protein
MKEVQIKHKQQMGAGAYHSVFPFNKYQDKVLKN